MMHASRLIYCIELIHLTELAFLLPNLNTYLPRSWMVRRSYLENPKQIIRKHTIQPWRSTSNTPRTTWSFLMKLWNSIKFKLTLGILPFNNWSWLVTSSTWPPYFVWKLFLISKLYISHLIEVMISSIVSFCQELSSMQVSISYAIYGNGDSRGNGWRGVCFFSSSTNHACKNNFSYEGLKFCSVLTHIWQKLHSYRNQSIDLHCKSIDWFL